MHITMDINPYFAIADSDLSYEDKLTEYEKLADAHFQTEAFNEFRAEALPQLDEVMWRLAQSEEFDNILVQTVQTSFPPHEHEQFIAHYRGLLHHWVEAESSQINFQ